MVERCRAGGELVFQRLSAHPRVTIARPEAAFYNFFSVDGVNDTMAFCKKLAKDYKVGLAPGEAFGRGRAGQRPALLRVRCRAAEQGPRPHRSRDQSTVDFGEREPSGRAHDHERAGGPRSQ